MISSSLINPFFAKRRSRPAPALRTLRRSLFVKLPRAPLNGSPVPHLTSLYHNSDAGDYGNRSYPGNCGGNLIRDLKPLPLDASLQVAENSVDCDDHGGGSD